MAVAVDDVGFSVFVDVVNEDRHAGVLYVEALMKFPFPFERVCGRFEPAVGDHEIAAVVAVDVAEAEAVTATAHLDDVLVELAGPFAGGV